MPKATAASLDNEKISLKTLEGGFVELRRMTYGQLLKRRSMAMNMKFGGRGKNDFEGEMALANQKVTEFEFASCIVDHNLEDDNGNLLNLANPVDIAKLDPRIGSEIDTNISRMNNFEDDDETGNS
jgi:hypothetical protein